MKILVFTLLYTLTVLFKYVESKNLPIVEKRNGVKYGLKYDGVVYPEGTYIILEDPAREVMRPYFIEGPVRVHPGDKLSYGGTPYALPEGKHWFLMNRAGQIGEPRIMLVKGPDNGDELIRDKVHIAIYEGGAFHRYKLEFQHKQHSME